LVNFGTNQNNPQQPTRQNEKRPNKWAALVSSQGCEIQIPEQDKPSLFFKTSALNHLVAPPIYGNDFQSVETITSKLA
jgi:hypothetical protein